MTLFLVFWLALLLLNMPIAFSLLLASISFLIYDGHGLFIIAQRLVGSIDSFPLLAVPFFIFAGYLMNSSGITRRIFHFARLAVGHISGGLGHVNILASVIFAGMSGAALADAAGLGAMEIKAMKDEDYDAPFAAAITAASSVIGPIIPPSIPMVLFAVLSGASIGQLFLAGFLPGLLMAAGLMVITFIVGRRRGYRVAKRPRVGELFRSFFDAFWALLTPIIIVAGILTGVFTPTEAAMVTVGYALVVSKFVYGSLTVSHVVEAARKTVEFTANIILVIAAASLFGWILTRERVPQLLTESLLGLSTIPTVVVLLIGAMVLVLGCFMEGNSIMLILVPMLIPTIRIVGIDPVHLGVVFVLSQMIGLVTPPFAVIVNVVAGIAETSFASVVRAITPFLIVLVIVDVLVAVMPRIVLFLPELLVR